jgi:hypothetical protein
MPILEEHVSPIRTFIAAFGLSSFAGVAAHLREGKPSTVLSGLVAGANSGCLGLALAMLWFEKFQDNIYFLIAICILAGLAGRPMVDAVATDFITTVKRWFRVKSEEPHDSDPK